MTINTKTYTDQVIARILEGTQQEIRDHGFDPEERQYLLALIAEVIWGVDALYDSISG
jgi:hypothetical protein